MDDILLVQMPEWTRISKATVRAVLRACSGACNSKFKVLLRGSARDVTNINTESKRAS
jgi:hypothetical protein